MAIQASVQKNDLQFKFEARTSRGAMPQHEVFYLKVWEDTAPEIVGIGECAPLPGLSPEYSAGFEFWLRNWTAEFNRFNLPGENLNISKLITQFNLQNWPSVRFGLETAVLDWQNNGRKILFDNSFSRSEEGIPINGLIWMGNKTFMQEQIQKKLNEGYSCLKLKIGGLDFTTELAILRQIRYIASASYLTIRLDANGAFKIQEAKTKLEQLAAYDIHSIEQPIKPQQPQYMAKLCAESPIPVALDEELIGIIEPAARQELLAAIKPTYIILKPTLLGGFRATRDWIALAEASGINWWITSALESNIGLNAISQFTAEFKPDTEQGLGTGQLYHTNIAAPLQIRSGKLYYNALEKWGNV